MKVYVAGPLSAATEQARRVNVERAVDVGIELYRHGHSPFIPHLTAYVEDRMLEQGYPTLPHETWVDTDLDWLEQCDALVFLGHSPGTDRELERARALRMPIFGYDYLFPERFAEWMEQLATGGHDDAFAKILDEMRALHTKKMADYGREADPLANVRASEDFGIPPWIGCMVRANDKMRRIQKFASDRTLVNESVEDSLMDLAVYAIIGLQLFREHSR